MRASWRPFTVVTALGIAAAGLAGLSAGAALAAPRPGVIIYVSPHGSDTSSGSSPGRAVATLGRAQQLVRSLDADMHSDITVELESGTYRLDQPLTLGAPDSGTNGYDVVWTAAPGAHPVVSGAQRVSGWHLSDPAKGIWAATVPAGVQTRQFYVNGVRADLASGPLPVKLTPTATGYVASSTALDAWRNPSQLEFVYTGGEGFWSLSTGGQGAWTEPRCPVASISGTTITMAEPCWDNSTERILRTDGSGRTVELVGPQTLGNDEIPAYADNAYELLSQPGQWYLDGSAHTLYYRPRPGQDMASADAELPVLQTLVDGAGTASAPVHNLAFRGIQFSYATWLQPSSPEGFSEIQANYTITGPDGYATQGLCQFVAGGTCPYGDWTQEPGNIDLQYDQDVQFLGDDFTHLGAAGLRLGDGSQDDTVQGSVFTDISGNGLELGGVDDPEPTATVADTTGNQVLDDHFYALPVEYHGGVAIDVGYAEQTLIAHNQIDNTAYTAISLGWGGWPDKIDSPATPNYSSGNVVSDNLIENPMQMLADGGAIYTQGITGSSLANGEQITGNVILGALDHGHAIYTDNGSTFITIDGNVELGNENDWGSRHTDYTAGATGDDPLLIENNYWQQGDQDNSSANVTESGNQIITSLRQVPAAILASAGLQPAYRGLASERAARPAVPEAPDQVAAFAAAGQADVTWNPAFVTNGAPVSSYRVTASPGGAHATISAAGYARLAYAVVPGLQDGTAYTFTVQAVNRAGASASSLPTAPVTVAASAGAVPAAPASVSLEPGNGAVSVHITAPGSRGGTPVTGYTITGYTGGAVSVGPVQFTGHHVLWGATGSNAIFTTIGGLKPLQPYTFQVTADNAAGASPAASTRTVILGTTPACAGASVTGSPASQAAAPGSTVQVTTTLTDGCGAALTGASLYLDAPPGWTVSPSSPVAVGDVPAGGSVARTWTVTVPATAPGGAAQLFEAAVFSGPGSTGHQEASASSAISVPYSSLTAAFDNVAITSDSAPGDGNADGAGYSFSAQALAAAGAQPGGTVTVGGLSYDWPGAAAGQPDNVVADGQSFQFTGSGTELGFLLSGTYVSASHGSAAGTGEVVYTDGSTSSFTLNAPDWHGGCSPGGAGVALYSAYRNYSGGQSALDVCVYAATVPLTAGKTISSVVLPDVSNGVTADVPALHVFAVAAG
ncbi:MAG TPA: fibronectin type III domain-containing protein [Trebonia sp.]|nr:fibronectin type III domain-containing protein [Trebonia sp.]